MAKGSVTWSLIEALAAQLATITQANGYLTDIGQHVWTSDGQRPSEDALGLMIYSESLTGAGLDAGHPARPVRDFTLLVEAAISTGHDDAQRQIHALIEDIETCMQAHARAAPAARATDIPMHVVDIALLDRPEGAAVVALQARIATRFLR